MPNNSLSKNQDIAEAFCHSEKILTRLLYIENFGRFCFFDDQKGYYKALTYDQLEGVLRAYLKEHVNKAFTMSTVKDIALQCKFECLKRHPNYYSDYVSFTDKLLNTKTLQLEDQTATKYSFVSIPLPANVYEQIIERPTVDVLSSAPNFKKFLEFILVHQDATTDYELIPLIQELFGYCFLPTVAAEATFFFVGDGANGKSKLLEVLQNLVGFENMSSSTIESLTVNKHATAALIGKRVNICAEESSEYMKQDKFKALISGEAVDVEAKFHDTYTERLPVKFIFATNEMPSFSGFNHAFVRRFKIIPFLRKISEQEKNTRIVETILPELPQIYAWAVQGMYRLLTNGLRFSEAASVNEKSVELEGALSSTVLFLRDRYTVSEDGFTSTDDLWTDYKVWVAYMNKKPMGNDRFMKDVGRFFDNKPTLRQRVDGVQKRGRPLIPKKDEL